MIRKGKYIYVPVSFSPSSCWPHVMSQTLLLFLMQQREDIPLYDVPSTDRSLWKAYKQQSNCHQRWKKRVGILRSISGWLRGQRKHETKNWWRDQVSIGCRPELQRELFSLRLFFSCNLVPLLLNLHTSLNFRYCVTFGCLMWVSLKTNWWKRARGIPGDGDQGNPLA